ncbi:uncharacterized protein LOC129744454 [Uranotaenia lowii]|uniref:uncharacterized protein LOC129744454 n=1 Tax=Uranotaenia lowii TaxID=190385 RepID=UPI00247873B4|nr:uncharacterized protein LOC129744454 [Uranotaenia lowii]
MSKEMMIVFVYDTAKHDEFHDPIKSVIYFHPSWVSETQKLLLCGQLMGTTHFLNETLFTPRIISLQSGKFALKSFGRFVLAVGSDRNISENVLEHRANFLYTLVKMYHCDINAIHEIYSNDQESKFPDKIYSIMESYLPLLQYNGNIFQNVSSLKIPKSASNLFLEATQILQSFQQTRGVLGGTIMYHNKVVASQLSDNLTKIFTLSDLYRLKSSEYINANFHIPVGVTLINAYIPSNEYEELLKTSTQTFNLFVNSSAKDTMPFQIRKKSFSKDSHSLMKRDKSLIFTNIPEEDMDDGIGTMKAVGQKKPFFSRPTHLPLFFKNPSSVDVMESGFSSINFDETDSFPNFIGKTSVCSTPLTENKVLPHSNVLSICAANENIEEEQPSLENESALPIMQSFFKETDYAKSEKTFPVEFPNFISNPYKSSRTRFSCNNIDDLESSMDQNHSDRSSAVAVPIRQHTSGSNMLSKSITDPTYPIFNNDGKAVSYSLFRECLKLYYTDLHQLATEESPKKNSAIKDPIFPAMIDEQSAKEESMPILPTTKKSRRDLNLPLKGLNLDTRNQEIQHATNIFDSPVKRKKLSGLQLTPLMSKLTMLAISDQQSSGFSSWDTTPGCSGLSNNPLTPLEYQPKRRKSKTLMTSIATTIEEVADTTSTSDNDSSKPIKVELFICVQQNMTLVLLLQEKSCEKENTIHSLFETCVSKLTRIENSLHQVMSINVEGTDKGDSSYSFICLDSKWDVNNRCGPWTSKDLLTLNSLHDEYNSNRKLMEFVVKSQDAVIYAYRCGRSEIYYQQSSMIQPGLPPPHDTMGTVPICAKRRLERDHRILLL